MPEATSSGEPDAGNLHVRFDEGRGTSVPSYSTGSVWYALNLAPTPLSGRNGKALPFALVND
jgi:hypothetical protein